MLARASFHSLLLVSPFFCLLQHKEADEGNNEASDLARGPVELGMSGDG